MVREQLTEVLNLRIAPTELDMLDRLSTDSGLPKAAILRQLVRREYAAQYGETTERETRAKRKPKRK
jgi:hypothetical protein